MPPTHGHIHPTPPHTRTIYTVHQHTTHYMHTVMYTVCMQQEKALLTTKVIHLLLFVLHTHACSNFI